MNSWDLDTVLRNSLNTYNVSEKKCLFELVAEQIENYSDKPAHSIYEMKRRENKTLKGYYWETFCQWYLINVKKYNKVWLWKEIPEEIKLKLNLTMRQDNGIDIVAMRLNKENETYLAVQCKYKHCKTKRSNKVSWKTLSTFVALCSRTGPWEQHLVMTNCSGVGKWDIPRTVKDKTIAFGTFKNMCRQDIYDYLSKPNDNIANINNLSSVASDEYVQLNDAKSSDNIQTELESLRQLRLKYFINQ